MTNTLPDPKTLDTKAVATGLRPPDERGDGSFRHLVTSLLYTVVTVLVFGLGYPLLMVGVGQFFPAQAGGSIVTLHGQKIGSSIVGQLWTKPQYFQGRPSAAGKGYDPTATGGTNLGPTSQKLLDAERSAIAALQKANPDAAAPIPIDLVTSSASGIDPDISPEAAYYQAPRIAKARSLPLTGVNALIARTVEGRTFGFLGEPHVNVLELNRRLDAT